MANKEQFKTSIGGQALIEGIMMRGPELDAIVVRGKDGICVETTPRKIHPKGSPLSWPFIRGVVNFFDAQVTGVKALPICLLRSIRKNHPSWISGWKKSWEMKNSSR